MNVDVIQHVTVVGAGTMGHGIAQTFAIHGYDVSLVDVDDDVLDSAMRKIEASVEQLGGDPDAVRSHVHLTTDRQAALDGTDVMVEAVPERIDLKREVFRDADEHAPARAVLASNTSTLPITEIATATSRPERVVGMHFSNPVQLMEVVEVIRGDRTGDRPFELTRELGEAIGKTPVLVEKDVPGFLLNRINLRFWTEALRQYDTSSYDTKTIDAAVRRLGFRMGPFELLDFSGIDVFRLAARSMQERDVSLHVPDVIEAKYDAEEFGMKSGVGFYEYPEPGEYARIDIPRERRYEFNPLRMVAPAVNEAAWLLANDVTTKTEIDRAVEVGMNWPRGLLEFADEYGIDRIVATLEELHAETGWEEYRPHRLLETMVEEGTLGLSTGDGFYEWSHEQTSFGPIDYERREFIAYITLNRPEKLNAMTTASWNGLRRALERATEDDDVRATIVRGAGRAFCAGDDIGEMHELSSVEEAEVLFHETLLPAAEALRTHPKPTIAAVDGVATGGGCEIVLLCDLAVAAAGSEFGIPEALIGAIPPIGLTYGALSLSRKDILELSLTGNRVGATEAEARSIVNYAVNDHQVHDVARELARETTAAAPGSVAAMKDLWTGVEDSLFEAWVRNAGDKLVQRTQTDEGQRGLGAFMNREEPPWKR
ncbi:3-hydroxyacyl-CoA dehydrogenase/enoyl-CoA hydratase family protein [Haladaptatus sp. DFWS20]|uniref:3-hydroxyacyl-CoA dehydrogenase/enoyl-CoA hydratase family protein n=1 Tax=Haladaptatus sp. DFWS20 TaxID=3403467 RepID=UPI003EBD404F